MKSAGIIGSGSWALALSKILKQKNLVIKSRDLKKAKKLFSKTNNIRLTDTFVDLRNCKYIFLAIPSQSMRENLNLLKKSFYDTKKVFIICSKGIEQKTNKLMSEVLNDFFPDNKFAILSGPNFSFEVIEGLPTASVLSSHDTQVAKNISQIILQERFRTYFNKDIIGTQIGGTMKNVVAIACGLILGKGLGNNAIASVITRGLSETVELGLKMGAKRNTFYGLSGIGDLTLTCFSLKSRNTKFGYYLGKSLNFSKIKKKNILAEGLESCESICKLGQKLNVELPICNSVKNIINGVDIKKTTNNLLSRPLQFEK